MFTGIVQKLVKIDSIDKEANLIKLRLDLGDLAKGIALGASIAVNGVCLTVSEITGDKVSFDIIPENSGATNLNLLDRSSFVNVERSYKVGEEIGGHIVSGHAGTTAPLVSVLHEQHDRVYTLSLIHISEPTRPY